MGLIGNILNPVVDDVGALLGATPATSSHPSASTSSTHPPRPPPPKTTHTSSSSVVHSTTSTLSASSSLPSSASTSAPSDTDTTSAPAGVASSAPIKPNPIVQIASPAGGQDTFPTGSTSVAMGSVTYLPSAPSFTSPATDNHPDSPPFPPPPPPPPRPHSLSRIEAGVIGTFAVLVAIVACLCLYRQMAIRRRRAKRDRMAARPTTWASQHGPRVRDSGWDFGSSSSSEGVCTSVSQSVPVLRLNFDQEPVTPSEESFLRPPSSARSLSPGLHADLNAVGSSAGVEWDLGAFSDLMPMARVSSAMDFVTVIRHPEEVQVDRTSTPESITYPAISGPPSTVTLVENPFSGYAQQPLNSPFSDYRFPPVRS